VLYHDRRVIQLPGLQIGQCCFSQSNGRPAVGGLDRGAALVGYHRSQRGRDGHDQKQSQQRIEYENAVASCMPSSQI
jgi:hypothetical protein